MAYPKVSIVVPTFNSQRYVEETVRSALAQTYSNFEVVVDDNASSDETVPLLSAIAATDKRLVIYPSSEDLNIPEGWNRAVGNAKGEYFLLLHSDNLLHPQYLEYVLERSERLGAKVAYTECEYFEGETPKGLFQTLSDFPLASHLAPGHRAVAYVFRHQRMVPTSCLLIHRSCLDGRPAYYPRYQFDPDMEQLASLVEAHGALHIHCTLSAIRTHKGQAPSWKKSGFSRQYRELLEIQHAKGKTERDHFLKQWASSNQDISTTLARNHVSLFYLIRYQAKWFAAESAVLGHALLESARHFKRWCLNFRTWFQTRPRKPKTLTPAEPRELAPQTTA